MGSLERCIAFPFQDDYLDCFGDSAVTGKEGTDIQDGKCTWLLINALDRMDRSGEDWQVLQVSVHIAYPLDLSYGSAFQENYGKPDTSQVSRVKQLYSRLQLERRYEEFELEEFKKLKGQIDCFPIIPLRGLLMDLLADLHQRKK